MLRFFFLTKKVMKISQFLKRKITRIYAFLLITTKYPSAKMAILENWVYFGYEYEKRVFSFTSFSFFAFQPIFFICSRRNIR